MDRNLELQARRGIVGPVVKISLLVSLSILFVAFVIEDPKDLFRSRSQFIEWYPQFGVNFASIAKNNCTLAYDIYLYGTHQNRSVDGIEGTGYSTVFVEPMIHCLLTNSNEYVKYALGSAQVMLGLTPTIIALLGASSEEVCLLALVGRRRFLALLLAIASPSIYTNRAFKYRSPSKILQDRLNQGHVNFSLQAHKRRFIVVAEYLVALTALANVATLSWELGLKSISGVNPDTVLMPLLWSFFAIPAHLIGVVIFSLRVRRVEYPDQDDLPEPRRGHLKFPEALVSNLLAWPTAFWRGLDRLLHNPVPMLRCWGAVYWNVILREFWLHPEQGPDEKIYLQWFQESRLFIICAWLLSVLVVFHIILGTLILSSTTFVGPRDALGVLARYVLSVVACRIILVYELAVMRVCYKNGRRLSSFQESNLEHGILEGDSKMTGGTGVVAQVTRDNNSSSVEAMSG